MTSNDDFLAERAEMQAIERQMQVPEREKGYRLAGTAILLGCIIVSWLFWRAV